MARKCRLRLVLAAWITAALLWPALGVATPEHGDGSATWETLSSLFEDALSGIGRAWSALGAGVDALAPPDEEISTVDSTEDQAVPPVAPEVGPGMDPHG
jgi:hypothetical protein